jgi:hypothetical protein
MIRSQVDCSQCGASINRVTWNYGRSRPIAAFFCDNECKGAWQRKQRENLGFTKEWLFSEYIEKRKSADQIAREIGRDPKRVWEWITDYGIQTRPRGAETGHSFKKGEESIFKGKHHTAETKAKMREIAIRQGRVPYDPAVGSYMKGRKGADTPSWKGGITPQRQSFYSTDEWKAAVKAVWKRDDAKCKRCGKNHNESAHRGTFDIHHIVGFDVVELRSAVSNLVLLCEDCHYFVHSNANTGREFIDGSQSA